MSRAVVVALLAPDRPRRHGGVETEEPSGGQPQDVLEPLAADRPAKPSDAVEVGAPVPIKPSEPADDATEETEEPQPLELQVPLPCDWSSDGFEGIRSVDGDFPEGNWSDRCGSPVPTECSSVDAEDVDAPKIQEDVHAEIAPKRKGSCAEACSPDEHETLDSDPPKAPSDDADLVASSVPLQPQALRGSASARQSGAQRHSVAHGLFAEGLENLGLATFSEKEDGIFTKRSGEGGKQHWCCNPLLFFPLLVTVLSVALCSVAFVALPIGNPLRKDGGSEWWHCALSCSTVWSGLTIVYMGQLLQRFVYKRAGQTMGLKAHLGMWLVFAAPLVISVFFVTGLWPNPAPMNGVIGTMVGLVGASIVVFFCLVPSLTGPSAAAAQPPGARNARSTARQSMASHAHALRASVARSDLREIQVSGLLVIVFSLLSAVALMTMLIFTSFLTWLNIWYISILGITIFKLALAALFLNLMRYLDKEALIVGANLATTSTGMCNIISMGGSSNSWNFTLATLVVDFVLTVAKVISMADVEVRGINVSQMLLDPWRFFVSSVRRRSVRSVPRLSREVVRHKYQMQLSKLVAEEIGEITVPLAFAFCWVVVLAGPNRRAFSGVGTSDFGLRPPDDVPAFMLMSGILVLANFCSYQLLKLALGRWAKIDLGGEVRTLFHEFGGILIVQTVWVTVTAFCMTMIQCGLDYSLQYSYLRAP